MAGHVLRLTNTSWAPWNIVDGTDDNYRHLRVGRELLASLERRLAEKSVKKRVFAPPVAAVADDRNVLSALNLDRTLAGKKYELHLAKWQGQLAELARHRPSRADRWCWCSRAWTRPARAARSAA